MTICPKASRNRRGTGKARDRLGLLIHGLDGLLGQLPNIVKRLPHRRQRLAACGCFQRRLHFFFKNGEGDTTRQIHFAAQKIEPMDTMATLVNRIQAVVPIEPFNRVLPV